MSSNDEFSAPRAASGQRCQRIISPHVRVNNLDPIFACELCKSPNTCDVERVRKRKLKDALIWETFERREQWRIRNKRDEQFVSAFS